MSYIGSITDSPDVYLIIKVVLAILGGLVVIVLAIGPRFMELNLAKDGGFLA
jgi:uncharacterized integral membrane protein